MSGPYTIYNTFPVSEEEAPDYAYWIVLDGAMSKVRDVGVGPKAKRLAELLCDAMNEATAAPAYRCPECGSVTCNVKVCLCDARPVLHHPGMEEPAHAR